MVAVTDREFVAIPTFPVVAPTVLEILGTAGKAAPTTSQY
jgi:hypothetical protein